MLVSGADDFPEIEIVCCPVTYDRQTEEYRVDLQFKAPFSPAALGHIKHFSINVEARRRLDDGLNDHTIIETRGPAYISVNIIM